MPAPLCFLTLEFTAKVKNPVDVPDIIKSSILTRIKKCRTSSIEQAQYLYNAEESYWKPKNKSLKKQLNIMASPMKIY
ncbi:hypothetical protein PYR73_17620 (plasmid) [Acinetobacter soli]|jgi:hypothetical protein|nr:hypothetical protein [Acinetobacter soli]WEI11120.1 hypothetical protein PYR73_17620 [Acinetobacter soli]WEI16859.1 hypothetical protein PX668_17190 [Acinetobacter soli]